jgi:universal stress protein A
MADKATTWLVPWAEDSAARRAFEEAIRLAAKTGARLELFHAISHLPDPFEPMVVSFGDGQRDLDPHLYSVADKVKARLEQVKEECIPLGDVEVDTTVAIGLPVEAVVARLNEGNYLGAIMGTHSRNTFERWMLGSVAEKVARDAPCPVVLIPAGLGEEPLFPPKRVATCVDVAWPDPQAADVRSVAEAGVLAEQIGAELDVLHAVEPMESAPLLSSPQVEATLKKARHENLERRRARLQTLRQALPPTLKVRNELLFRERGDSVAETIEEWVKKENIQLVVAAAHNKDWLSRVLGSVAGKIARMSSVAVMVVKPPKPKDG